MYDPYAVLAAIDAHKVGVLTICAITLIGTYTWFIQAIRLGARDKTYVFPLFCTIFWFAHDTSFVARFDQWFNTYDHWFLKLFWFALVITATMEVIYLRQTLRYGRDELTPWLSQRAYALLLAGAVISGLIIWWSVKATLDDSLYVIAFALTIAVYPPFAIALTLSRRSIRGQSVVMWLGFCGLDFGWFSVSTVYFGPAFHSWQWLTLAAFSCVGGLAGTWLVARAGRYGLAEARTYSPVETLVRPPG